MIISRKHRYIFLHCRKTAGSSISVALARDLGPDDLQLSGLKETFDAGIPYTARLLREAREAMDRQPLKRLEDQLHLSGLLGGKRRSERVVRLIRARYRAPLGAYPYHARAEAIAQTFPDDWAAFPKFCVVRNPWDKTLSDYFWRIRKAETPPSFEAFVKAMRDGDRLGGIVPGEPDNWPLYTIDNRIVADEVIRFERLAQDLEGAMARLNIPWDGWLPHAKSGTRPRSGGPDKAALYTDALRQIVGDLFAREVEAFGYAP